MSAANLGWYWRRLGQMTTREVVWRAEEQARRQAWRRRQVEPSPPRGAAVVRGGPRVAPAALPPGLAATVPDRAARALESRAAGILRGEWVVLGVARPDIAEPDWFYDPLTQRRAPQSRYAFRVNPRSEAETGNVKQVWEVSRHHHLTVLAAAWWLTGDDGYAKVVDEQLRSWWQANPFLSGVHWTSGIELGIRLISWTWVRRLLEGWPGAPALFEENPQCHQQLRWHQQYLAAFTSRGSSANNHVIAEAAGQLTASCAFPWFAESGRWRRRAAQLLTQELERNTFPSGVNRELASEYHCFVAALGLVAVAEAAAAGHPVAPGTEARLCGMVDAAAALVDERLAGPRQGDGDDGQVLTVDGAGHDRWAALLTLGAAYFGAQPWWPAVQEADVATTVLCSLSGLPALPAPPALPALPALPAGAPSREGRPPVRGRPTERPWHFADAGITILRTTGAEQPEIWCRADAGPHGFLAIAAHAHADALAVEVRHGGTEVFTDPGTFCYHGEPAWRSYFRSTVGHNTIELAGRDQSTSGGPFLWVSPASTHELKVTETQWSAEHDGYGALDPPAIHRRSVHLDRVARCLTIIDQVISTGRHPARMAFHLGPAVNVEPEATQEAAAGAGSVLHLSWPGGAASLHLPHVLQWQAHRGETEPILGWYSPTFGCKQEATTLLGTGLLGSADGDAVTVIDFHP